MILLNKQSCPYEFVSFLIRGIKYFFILSVASSVLLSDGKLFYFFYLLLYFALFFAFIPFQKYNFQSGSQSVLHMLNIGLRQKSFLIGQLLLAKHMLLYLLLHTAVTVIEFFFKKKKL